MSRTDRLDVAVLGGGPAGLAAALSLCRRGLRVGVITKENRVRHWGETLPASASAVLARLGVLIEDLDSASHLVTHEHRSIWGSPIPRGRSAVYNAYGSNLIVERERFLTALRAKFESEGGVLIGSQVLQIQRVASGFSLHLFDSSDIPVSAVIDATGSTAWAARRLGGYRSTWARQIAFGACYQGSSECSIRLQSLIEATPRGWLYAAPLLDLFSRRATVWWVTDRNTVREGRCPGILVTSEVRQSIEISRWFHECGFSEPDCATARNASIGGLEDPVGDGWVAVGDAALTLDPLSSCGITFGLLSGLHGAAAMARWLEGDSTELTAYARLVAQARHDHLAQRQRFHQLERRFKNAPFWEAQPQ